MKKLFVLAVLAIGCVGMLPHAAHAQSYYPGPIMQQPQLQPYSMPYQQYQQPYVPYQQYQQPYVPYQPPYQSSPYSQPCMPAYNYSSCVQPQIIPQCGQASGGNSQQMYRCGLSLVYARRYAEAIQTFQQFLSYYPQSSLADNALYWTGEAYYAQKQYYQALSLFQQVLTRYPQGNKVPDALLKMALSYMSLKRNSEGCQYLNELRYRYPNSEPAQKAYRWLDRCGYSYGGGGTGYTQQPYSSNIPQPWYGESALPKYW